MRLPVPVHREPALAGHQALLQVVRTVRNRWRLKVLLRGLAIVVAGGVVVTLLASWGIDHFRFAPGAVLGFRLVAYTVVVGLAAWTVLRPLWRALPDERVALYLEERAPSLGGRVLTAVEAGGPSEGPHSPALARRLVEQAVAECAALDHGRGVDRSALNRAAGAVAGASVMALALVALDPGSLRHGAALLFTPWRGASEANPYVIEVLPGDTLVARGADVRVTASLRNLAPELVELVARRGASAAWERWEMAPDDSSGYAVLLFNLSSETEYFVEAAGVRSPMFRITVADLPYVERLALEYRYPAYTGLEPRREEQGGDIAALAGTEVVLTVTPTLPVVEGRIVLDGRDTLPLTLGAGGLLTGSLRLERPGAYRIALKAATTPLVPASPDYVIDVLEDRPPTVVISRPGRDLRVTAIDEVFTEIEAVDDYGVTRVELVYSVNGGPDDTLAVHSRRSLSRVVAGHTFYLEELGLRPGDVVAYHARAADARRRGARAASSDIYFLEIRPFDLTYRQADQAPGMPGGEGEDVGQLSRRQREIVAATFNLARDSATYPPADYRGHLTTLALSQGRLREEVETLVRRLENRGIVALDSSFGEVALALPLAAAAMRDAEEQLGRLAPRGALPPEQRALRELQRAEAAFRERMVAQGEASAGSPGEVNADELADLFELELDRSRNQYEQLERGRREEAGRELDETMARLRELARRQQQENERMRARTQQRGEQASGAAAGGGGAQRRLADETEELARRLERLSRQQSQPEMAETARQLREAADAMRRAAAGGEGTAQGAAALDRLEEARRLLDRNRSAGLRREAEDALRRAERLTEEQREVVGDVEALPEDPSAAPDRLGRLLERKGRMAQEVGDLESQLDRLSRDARAEHPEASTQLRRAASAIRDGRFEDKIRYSQGVVQSRSREYARNFEEQIGADLDSLRRQVEEAVSAMGESREQQLDRNLDRTRDLANALESLAERAGQQGDSGPAEGDAADRGATPGRLQQGRPGSPGGDRQLRDELRARRNQLSELREAFRRQGVDVRALDELMSTLGRADNAGPVGTPRGLDQLARAVVQGLREFEFAVRRQLQDSGEPRFLGGTGDVPAEYRRLVEEYYRSLAERGRGR